jgi:thiol-disulfide isomerase/thioredoxin
MRTIQRGILVALSCLAFPAGASVARAALPSDAEPATAQHLMAAAETKAAAEHKNLLVDFGASWCGNCKLFDRFWDDPQMHPLMTRVFERVTLDINETDKRHPETPGAYEVLHSLGGGKDSGLPYLAMATAGGKLIIASEKKSGDWKSGIGYPDAPDEIEWWMHMLQTAAPSLSKQEMSDIKIWLQAHSTHPR